MLGPTCFLHSKVSLWSTTIIENILKELKEINDEQLKLIQGGEGLGQLWKFVVTCFVQQKTGAGMQSATCCYWDQGKDGHFSVTFDNSGFTESVGSDAIECICTVYFASI